MSNVIKISDWKGVFTNGDRAQLSPDFCVELKNLRPINGKLQKTFGIGSKISTAITNAVDNLYTYIHDELSGDELYIGVFINTAADNIVTVYAWNGSNWVALNSISGISHSGNFYHKHDRNPIIYADGILRILPGNLGESPAGEECKGIWLGYIDRDYFDGLYSPTAEFYGMAATIDAPDMTALNITTSLHISGTDMPFVHGGYNTMYYKYSYIYDGIQESLPSEPIAVYFPLTQYFVDHVFHITYASHNKRITSINVYRASESEGPYYLVDSIDLIRESGTVQESATGAVIGDEFIYLPDLAGTYLAATDYKIAQAGGSATKRLCNPIANGSNIFKVQTGVWFDEYNGQWELFTSADVSLESDSDSGAYAGSDVIITTQTDLGAGGYAWGVVYFDDDVSRKYRLIRDNYKKVIRYYSTAITVGTYDGSYQGWKALKPSDGIYRANDNTTYTTYTFFDTGGYEKTQHPLQYNIIDPVTDVASGRYEKYIKVNGKFARIINNRMLKGNIVLDPGGTNEAHDDWISYSEFGQYDVNPVSNVLDFPDTFGGELKGIAELFGNPVILKQHNIFFLNSKTHNTEPARWNVIESPHHLGNLADEGYIEAAGSLFVCYVDGIYRLRPNNLAATDSTPTERLRVSEPIGDVYNDLSLTQKKAIQSGYNPETSEVMFVLGSEIWAFDIVDETWREILSGVTPAIISTDENGQAIVFQTSDKKLYSFGENESVAVTLATKTFELSTERDRVVKSIAVTYKAAISDYTGTVSFTGSGLDDMTAAGTLDNASPVDYKIKIDATGTPDSFTWSDDGGETWNAAGVDITGAAQILNSGITITFAATTGHTSDDYWEFTASAITMKVFYDDEIPSGDIQDETTYTVRETPYIDGATYEVTYNGTAYTHGETFTGLVGLHTYTVSGTGVVELCTSHTLAANTAVTTKKLRIARWCKRLRIEITDTSGTSDMQIDGIVITND